VDAGVQWPNTHKDRLVASVYWAGLGAVGEGADDKDLVRVPKIKARMSALSVYWAGLGAQYTLATSTRTLPSTLCVLGRVTGHPTLGRVGCPVRVRRRPHHARVRMCGM
jgi:hypothetical protein